MDYRQLYKNSYKIEFNNNFEIHHINMDRKDNSIENLLLLPKELHRDYHNRLKQLCACHQSKDSLSQNPTTITIDLTSIQDFTDSLPVLNDLKRELLYIDSWAMFKWLNYESDAFDININLLRKKYMEEKRNKSL